jgi:hypothetical protein
MGADAWGDWEAAKFAPEEKFLEKIKAISGISQVSHYRKRVPYEKKNAISNSRRLMASCRCPQKEATPKPYTLNPRPLNPKPQY